MSLWGNQFKVLKSRLLESTEFTAGLPVSSCNSGNYHNVKQAGHGFYLPRNDCT